MFEQPRKRDCPLESTSSVICAEGCGCFVGVEPFVVIVSGCAESTNGASAFCSVEKKL